MKVLGIDTSSLVLSIAVVESRKVLGEYTTNLKKNHSVRLMPAISMLLDELELEPGELDAIAVAHGPGSYTGVRIGLTTAKSLAFSLGIAVMGISSLETLAGNASSFSGLVCPLMDARRGQVYTALFEAGERRADDCIRMMNEWAAQLRQEQKPVLFLGDDICQHVSTIQRELGSMARFGPIEWNIPSASYVARRGLELIEQGNEQQVDGLVPQYLQLAEAESKWLANQKNREKV